MEAKRKFFDVPPLRYVGAKWMLADWILAQFPPHECYVEPFAGSAAVFFRKYPSAVEVLNDIDGDVVNFFRVLREAPDELLRAIELTPYSREEYQNSLGDNSKCDAIERARRFYVALWQSFGGTIIYNSGWRRQLINNLRKPVTDTWRRTDGLLMAADRLKDAQIDNIPAVECIQLYDHPNTLFYVDPPYVKSARQHGSRSRYRHEMTDDDHRTLADVLHNVWGMVVLSGYASSLYNDLYSDWIRIEKTTTTNGNGKAVEYLWMSPRTTSMNVLPLFKDIES